MRSDEGSGDSFFYGPSVMVPYREPFANECYLFGDSRYHACGRYADLEKKFLGRMRRSRVRSFLIRIIILAWIQMKTWMKMFR
jgi:hypothetical protein